MNSEGLARYAKADADLTWKLTEDLAKRDFEEFERMEAYMREVRAAGGQITV